jgi:hypothetical protein
MTAERLLNKSVEAHGGVRYSNQIKSIKYLKTTTLFTPNGDVEKTVEQLISHHWNPDFTQIEWKNEGGSYLAKNEAGTTTLTHNGELVKDSLILTQTTSNLDAALYVFWQPFKLRDPSAKKVYLGKQRILDSLDFLGIKVSYSDDPKADLWYYYFDPKSFKLRAVKVLHNNRTSLIINERYENKTGLSLNKVRKSYFLDSLDQIDYLRAAYLYEIEGVTP